MKITLLRMLREIIHADSDPVRQALFDHLRDNHLLVKLVWRSHRRLSPSHFASMLIFLYGVKSYITAALPRGGNQKVLALAVHANARKRIQQLASWIGDDAVVWLRLNRSLLLCPQPWGRLIRALPRCRNWMRFYRVANRLDRRYDFLVSCRTTSALFSYVLALEILPLMQPRGVIVSSDSNPEPLAFARAADVIGIPTIFISHAYPTPVSPPLQFTLSILEGQAAFREYQQKGPTCGHVIFCGVEGESQPMQPGKLLKHRPTVGIFTPKVVLWPRFAELVADCRRFFAPEKILIRLHPSMLGTSRLATTLSAMENIFECPPERLLCDAAQECDWVIADENSNVHLGVLRAGIPTVAVRNLTVLPESRADLYGFVRNRVIPSSVTSLSEVSMAEIFEFYSTDWALRFRDYDAGYLIPSVPLAERNRDAILQVLSNDHPAAHQ